MIEDLPNFIFFESFILKFELADKILKSASFTIFHDDINSEVFLVDLKIQISEEVNVVHVYKGVDFINDMFFLFGRNRRKGDFFYHDCIFAVQSSSLQKVV